MHDYTDYMDEPRNHVFMQVISLLALLGILMLAILMALTSGCVTASKQLYAEATAPPPTPTPAPTPTPTPIPTQPPREIIAEYGTAMPMNYWVDWRRDDVSGLKDLSLHATIYGYRIFDSVEWYSVSWGKYYTQVAPAGTKYLFVFAHVYSDDHSATTYGLQPEYFKLIIDNREYNQTADLLPQIRLKELDEVWDMRHVHTIQPYGYLRRTNDGIERADPLGYLKAGKSNAWDGYIVYLIPENTRQEDIRVWVPLTKDISASWQL